MLFLSGKAKFGSSTGILCEMEEFIFVTLKIMVDNLSYCLVVAISTFMTRLDVTFAVSQSSGEDWLKWHGRKAEAPAPTTPGF